jgi:16S rRNA (adenine1518-N6/adenine1519-N6)-dimethyltransferase
VQREVADRLTARAGEGAYGPVSILTALLGELRAGPGVPATAFWPRPKVASRILRIDFAAKAASRLRDAETLRAVLRGAFEQRRKQLAALLRRAKLPFERERLAAAMQAAGIDLRRRAEQIAPEQYLLVANALSADAAP